MQKTLIPKYFLLTIILISDLAVPVRLECSNLLCLPVRVEL